MPDLRHHIYKSLRPSVFNRTILVFFFIPFCLTLLRIEQSRVHRVDIQVIERLHVKHNEIILNRLAI